MKVSELMTKNPVTVQPSATAKDAAEIMKKENLGTVLVAEGDRLEGLITDRQIATKVIAEGKDPARTRVNEFMTKNPVSASPDMEVEDVTKIMGENKYRRVPVVQDGKLIGIVSTADIAEHARTCSVCIDNILNEAAKAER